MSCRLDSYSIDPGPAVRSARSSWSDLSVALRNRQRLDLALDFGVGGLRFGNVDQVVVQGLAPLLQRVFRRGHRNSRLPDLFGLFGLYRLQCCGKLHHNFIGV